MPKTKTKTQVKTTTKVALITLALGSFAAAIAIIGIDRAFGERKLTVQFVYGAGEKCQGLDQVQVEKIEPSGACRKTFLGKNTYYCKIGSEVKVWLDTPYDSQVNPDGCEANGRWGCDKSGYHYCVVNMNTDRQVKYEVEKVRPKK